MIINSLLNMTALSIEGKEGGERLAFHLNNGTVVVFYHEQDCCESVWLGEISGDLNDLVGEPLIQAEVVSTGDESDPETDMYFTWVFYKFATIKGSVTVRWNGQHNGYYSTAVDTAIISEE